MTNVVNALSDNFAKSRSALQTSTGMHISVDAIVHSYSLTLCALQAKLPTLRPASVKEVVNLPKRIVLPSRPVQTLASAPLAGSLILPSAHANAINRKHNTTGLLLPQTLGFTNARNPEIIGII